MRAILVILLTLIVGGGGWYLGTRYGAAHSPGPNTSDSSSENSSPVGNQDTIHCQGKLVPASGLIKIVAPPGERIFKLIDRQVGEVVNVDEILVTLHSLLLREKDLELAKAHREDALKKAEFEKEQGAYRLDSAKLALAEADSSEEKIASEAQKIRLLERQLAAAERMLARLHNIQSNPVTNDLINQTEIDKQELLVEQLRLQIELANLEVIMSRSSAARAKAVATNNLRMIENSLENADKAMPLESLDAAVAMAQQAYDMTQIKSPLKHATVLDIIVREGDSATNQPVMILGDTSEMVCIAEVNDLFLELIDLEKDTPRAKITSNALDQPLMGTVIAKGVMIGPPSLQDPNPFASVDRRTVTVTIKLDDSAAAAKFVNLQVEVEIDIKPRNLE